MLLLQIDVFLTFKSKDESNLILYLPFYQSSKLMGKPRNEGPWRKNADGAALHRLVSARVDTVTLPWRIKGPSERGRLVPRGRQEPRGGILAIRVSCEGKSILSLVSRQPRRAQVAEG